MEAISEVQSFLEESLSDEDIGDVSPLIGFDGSRMRTDFSIFSEPFRVCTLIAQPGSSDVCLQLGMWLRKRRGVVTAFYIWGDFESSIPEFDPGIIEHQARCICQSMGSDKNFSFESFKRTEKYKKTPVSKILIEKLNALHSTFLVVGTAGLGGVSASNLTKSIRPLLYYPVLPVLFGNARVSIDVMDMNSMFVALPSNPADAELMVKSSCFLINPAFEVYLYHIREPDTSEEYIQSLRRYFERKQTTVHLLIEDPAPFKTKMEQIVRKMSHYTNVPIVVMGTHCKAIPPEASLSEIHSTAERILKEVTAHLFVVKFA